MSLSIMFEDPPQGLDPILRDWLGRFITNLNGEGALDPMTFSATPQFDASSRSVFSMTLTGNVTSSTIVNGRVGQTIILILTQDGTGGRTFAWPSNVVLAGGTTIKSDADYTSVVPLVFDGTYWREVRLEPTTLDGVTIGGTTPAAGTFTTAAATTVKTNTLEEKTASNGVQCASPFKVDHIAEKTASHNIVYDNIVQRTVQPAFSVDIGSSHTNFAAGVLFTVNFDTENFDIGGNFNTTTKTFTAPVTGYYFLSARIRVDAIDTAASYYRLYLTTTKKTAFHLDHSPAVHSADYSYVVFQIAQVFYMEANDTAKVEFYQSGGANQSDITAAASYHNFSGYLLG